MCSRVAVCCRQAGGRAGDQRLVGVLAVDISLALPDFRAGERTFQLITQVAGRAGRGDKGGRVLLQTYHPEHYALRHAAAQDFRRFYDEEIRHRRNHGYPPFVALALILSRHKEQPKAHAAAMEFRKAMVEANHENACRILGPAPAPLAKLRQEHRFQLLLKGHRATMREAVRRALVESYGPMRWGGVVVDVDPINIM